MLLLVTQTLVAFSKRMLAAEMGKRAAHLARAMQLTGCQSLHATPPLRFTTVQTVGATVAPGLQMWQVRLRASQGALPKLTKPSSPRIQIQTLKAELCPPHRRVSASQGPAELTLALQHFGPLKRKGLQNVITKPRLFWLRLAHADPLWRALPSPSPPPQGPPPSCTSSVKSCPLPLG